MPLYCSCRMLIKTEGSVVLSACNSAITPSYIKLTWWQVSKHVTGFSSPCRHISVWGKAVDKWKCFRNQCSTLPVCVISYEHSNLLNKSHCLTYKTHRHLWRKTTEKEKLWSNFLFLFNWINQPDAAISQVYYLSFKYSSTCFGNPHTHHQELNKCSSSLWFYRWKADVPGTFEQFARRHDEEQIRPQNAITLV
jgi:hypothetical protein